MKRRSFLGLLGIAGVAQWLGPLVAIQGCAGSSPATRSTLLTPTQLEYMKRVEKAFEKHKDWGCGAVPQHVAFTQGYTRPLKGKVAGVVYCNICNFQLDIEVQSA